MKKEDRRQWKQIASANDTQKARTILNERIIRPNQNRVLFSLISSLWINKATFLFASPCVLPRRLCWHYIYIIMKRMKVLFYCDTQGSLFSLFNRRQEVSSSFDQEFLPFKLLTFFHGIIINVSSLLSLRYKYSYQQLMLFAICTNIYIKKLERKKHRIMFFNLLSCSESLNVKRLKKVEKLFVFQINFSWGLWEKHVLECRVIKGK